MPCFAGLPHMCSAFQKCAGILSSSCFPKIRWWLVSTIKSLLSFQLLPVMVIFGMVWPAEVTAEMVWCAVPNYRCWAQHGIHVSQGWHWGYNIFPKIGVFPPKWMVKIMENPIEMDDLRGKPPIFGNIHILFLCFSQYSGCQVQEDDHVWRLWETWKKLGLMLQISSTST